MTASDALQIPLCNLLSVQRALLAGIVGVPNAPALEHLIEQRRPRTA